VKNTKLLWVFTSRHRPLQVVVGGVLRPN
jgi:hypothetical protein